MRQAAIRRDTRNAHRGRLKIEGLGVMRYRPAFVFSITCWSCSPSTAASTEASRRRRPGCRPAPHGGRRGDRSGPAFRAGAGRPQSINRAGYFVLPMDETLAVVAVDLAAADAGLQRPGACAAGGRFAGRTAGRFLWRLRESRGRESARQGDVRPVEPSQGRGDFQMLGQGDAVCVLERCAVEGAVAFDEGVAMKRAWPWRGQSCLQRRESSRRFFAQRTSRNVGTTALAATELHDHIFDYGAGNLRSVENTLAELGCAYTLVRDCEACGGRTRFCSRRGHFGQMMRALDELDVRAALVERIRAGVPFLGSASVCRRCLKPARSA